MKPVLRMLLVLIAIASIFVLMFMLQDKPIVGEVNDATMILFPNGG